MADLKQTFIIRCLQQYNKDVEETMQSQMRKMNVEVTGDGYKSFAHKILTSGKGAYSELTFNQYLRFVDMGVGRGYKLGALEAVRTELQASRTAAMKQIKKTGRKRKQIYSKIAYGKLPYLTGKLLHGYTEEAIADLKRQLQTQSPNP